MARNYANVSTAIWRDEDFRARTASAQWMYLLLVSQPDISAAGVLPLAIQRWSKRAADTKPGDVRDALAELQRARFVVYDEDTEELLVRSFVKWDGGAGNPKRRPVIVRAAHDVESPTIRRAIASEFGRLGLPTEGLIDRHADSLSGSRSMPISKASGEAADGPENGVTTVTASDNDGSLFSQPNSLSDSDTDSDTTSDGVVVTKGTYLETTTHNPQPTTTPAAKRAQKRAVRATVDDPEFVRFWEIYPKKIAKGAARRAWTAAAKKVTPERIIWSAQRYREAERNTEARFIANPATWLNGERWDDQTPTRNRQVGSATGGAFWDN